MYRLVNAIEAYEVIEKQTKSTVDKWKMDSGLTASEIMTTTKSKSPKNSTIIKKKPETIGTALELCVV